jgi:glutathionylspermidine synthase
MRREDCQPRPGLADRIRELNLWGRQSGGWYDETAAYVFTGDQIETLYQATTTLNGLIGAAVDHVIAERRFDELGITPALARYAALSRQRGDPALYGRMDLAWDGTGPPKLLEFNGDTPTALVEAAVLQWEWLQALHPDGDQFNSLHEGLVGLWRELRAASRATRLTLAGILDEEDDLATLSYMEDAAYQAGWQVRLVSMDSLGLAGQTLVDDQDRPVEALFKLYPWDWMADEPFFAPLAASGLPVLEAPWKAIASSKGLLAVLWELFPGHPNLLPASLDLRAIPQPRVIKPVFGREGASVRIEGGLPGAPPPDPTPYDSQPMVAQAFHPLPQFDGWYPVIGSWVVDGVARGIGIREDRSPVTGAGARFRPHRIG